MTESIVWKIGGEAGFGIMSSGTMLARTFSRAGYHVQTTNDYPSLIRGGHNLITVRIASYKFHAMNRGDNILIALNKQTVEFHKDELLDDSLVVFDPRDFEWKNSDFSKPVHCIALPFTEIVRKANGDPIMRNTVALGATIALLGSDFELFAAIIRDQFKRKGEEVVKFNLSLAKSGFDHIREHYKDISSMYIAKPTSTNKQLILNASEAVGIGAIRAGLKFAAIYPMTPINSLISFLADHERQLKVVYLQPEDEIAGINMAIGASIAGVRSMVATSGGGFALMVEGLSLAGMVEAPLVIDLGMRVGPATGMPTYTEQGELLFAIHAGHGEFPRIVLAPSDAAEAYTLTIVAFHLADRYHVPVFILTDKYINESQWCVPIDHFQGDVVIDRGPMSTEKDLPPNGSFRRYASDVTDGISPRSIPGMKGGFYIANSYEHDETGFVTEDAKGRALMVDKRMKKFSAIQREMKPPSVFGDGSADITFVSWGSSRGPVLEAMKLLSQKGIKTKLIHFSYIFPFPDAISGMLSQEKRLIDVEQNATAQLAQLIRTHTGIEITEKILKYDGRPFFPEEIVEKVSSEKLK